MERKAPEFAKEVGEVKEIVVEVKDEIKDIASEEEEAVDWVVRTIVLVLCGGFLAVVLGILLFMLAII